MSDITETLNQRLSMLGRSGIIGLGILVCSITIYNTMVVPMQQVLSEQQQRNSKQPKLVESLSQADWHALKKQLPPEAQADRLVANIYRIAEDARVNLREAEYKEDRAEKSNVMMRHLDFVITGDYFQIHQFLSSVLNKTPSLALRSIAFQKSNEKQAEGLLDVRISMTLYLIK